MAAIQLFDPYGLAPWRLECPCCGAEISVTVEPRVTGGHGEKGAVTPAPGKEGPQPVREKKAQDDPPGNANLAGSLYSGLQVGPGISTTGAG